jgi:DNA primase
MIKKQNKNSSFKKNNGVNPKDVARIKTIAKKYEKELLHLLGFSNITNKGIQQKCPIHGGDNPTAFSYDLYKHCWSCFSQHCEKVHGNDIIGLVRGIKNLSFNDAVKWLKELVIDNKNIDWSKIDESIDFENLQSIHKKSYNKVIDESKLDNLVKDYSSLQDRGFNEETLKTFEGGVSTVGEMYHHRFMIPIRNELTKLVGFTGRSIYNKCSKCGMFHKDECPKPEQGKDYSKWRHYPPLFHKQIELYNIDKAKSYIYKTNTCVIVEGPFDVWKLWQHGVKNVVGSFGTSLSYEQCSLLTRQNCINLILMFDTDDAGIKATKDSVKMTNQIFKVFVPELPKDIDPGELGISEYNEYIKPFIEKIKNI